MAAHFLMATRKAQPAAKVAAPKAGGHEVLRAHTVFGYTDIDGVEKRAYIGDVIRVSEEDAVRLKAAHLAGGAVGMGQRTGDGKPVIVRADTDDEYGDTEDDDEIAMDGDHYFDPGTLAPVTPVDAEPDDGDE